MLFADDTIIEPDVMVVHAESVDQLRDPGHVDLTPAVVVEVSSPSSDRRDRGPKLALYEREGVAEHWLVELEAEHVEVYRLAGDRYGSPEVVGRGERVASSALPGLVVPVDDVLGPPAG